MAIIEETRPELQIAQNYVDRVYNVVQQRNPGESEFQQAVKEIFMSLVPVFAKQPKYMEANILRTYC